MPRPWTGAGSPPARTVGAPAALLASLLAACAHTPATVPLPDVGRASCVVAGEPAAAADGQADTLRVSAPGPALRRTAEPGPASRLVDRQLHATLVRVDCRGRIRAGLAESWETEDGGRRWIFRLPDHDAPPDPAVAGPRTAGTEGHHRRGVVTAPAVARAWQRAHLRARPGAPSPLDGASAVAEGPRTLAVTLRRPLPSPALFADPRFAVAVPDGRGRGRSTGSHRPASPPAEARGDGALRLAPRAGGGPHVSVIPHAGRGRGDGPDPRDLLDRGVDVLVSRDARTLAYARTLGAYRTVPLPWRRTYVLALPTGGDAAGAEEAPPAAVSSTGGGAAEGPAGDRAMRKALARDVVPGEARPALPPHWWTAACELTAGEGSGDPDAGRAQASDDGRAPLRRPSAEGPPRIVYPAGDEVARSLATRLGALAGPAAANPDAGGRLAAALAALGDTPGTGPVRAVGLDSRAWRGALREGDEAGYVIPLPRRVLAACPALDDLVRRGPWLVASPAAAVPLVDTRPRLVLRRGVAGITLDWDGVPRLAGARRPRTGGSP